MQPEGASDRDALEREVQRLRERAALLVDRAARLQRLTVHLSRALTAAEVAEIAIDEGTSALGAVSGAMWQMDEGGATLVLLRAHNYPPAAIDLVREMPMVRGRPITDAAVLAEPIWLGSRAEYVSRYPESENRTRPMNVHPVYATASLPLRLDERVIGALAFTFASDRGFDDDERTFLSLVAAHCAQGLERARLLEVERRARRAAEAAGERASFLARASAQLGATLALEETLRTVAALAVPGFADWCAVELLDPEAELGSRQVAVAHVDPAKVAYADELRRRYPPELSAPTGVHHVMRTGKSELYPMIPEELLVAGARDAEHLRIIRELGLRSAMVVPIRDRGVTVGAMTFIIAESDRSYGPEDLLMAEQVGERAGAAIENARLYDEAVTAVRLRDEFLSIAGHELRTPLAALSLHLQTLQRMPDTTTMDKVKQRAAKLLGQCDRLERLIAELLDVSRISAGRLDLELEHVDLAAVVAEITDRMRDELARAGCTTSVTLEPAEGRWDRARLDQIVTNLLSNAMKYGKDRPVEVRVEVRPGVAALIVRDHGIGISDEDQARIFERFERAVSSRHFGGLGLGLWIVHQLVAAHGGTIAVRSKVGEGAEFVVTLPRSESDEPDAQSSTPR